MDRRTSREKRRLGRTASVVAAIALGACGGSAEVVVAPRPSASVAVTSATASASAVPAVAEPTPKKRHAGSAYVASTEEPLPPFALARCGSTAMRVEYGDPVAVDDEGRIFAVVEQSKLTDVRTRAVLAELPRNAGADFAPDAHKLMVENGDTFELFEVPSGRSLGKAKLPLQKPKPSQKPRLGKFSITGPGASEYTRPGWFTPSGGRYVVPTSKDALHVIDGVTGALVKSISNLRGTPLATSGDATRVLVSLREPGKADAGILSMSYGGGGVGIAVVDVATGARVYSKSFEIEEPMDMRGTKRRKHEYAAFGLSLDGKTIYRYEHGDLASIDVATGKETALSSSNDFMSGFYMGSGPIAMDRDGRHGRVGSKTFDLVTGDELAKRAGAAFTSPSGEYELMRTGSVVHLASEAVVGHTSAVNSVAFFPAGEALASTDGKLKFWDTASCGALDAPDVRAEHLTAARDAALLVTDGYPSLIVDGAGKVTKLQEVARSTRLGITSDGARIFLGTSDFEEADLQLRDAAGTKLASVPLDGSSRRVVVSPSGARVAVDVDKEPVAELQIRKGDTLELVTTMPSTSDDLLFLDDERLLTFDGHRGVGVLSADGLKQLSSLGAGNCCAEVAVSKDGRRVAGASGNDVYVWEVGPRDEGSLPRFLGQLSGHTKRVTSLSFSAEGVLASGSADTTILLWDLDAMKTPSSTSPATAVAGPTDAARWASGDFDGNDFIADDGTVTWARPKDRPVLRDAAALSVNYSSVCAVVRGKVQCWGSTRGGILGTPERSGAKPYDFISVEKPAEVPNVSGAVDVELGAEYACALDDRGRVTCWGRQGVQPIAAPAEVMSGVIAIGVRPSRACALTTSRELVCWAGDVARATFATKVRSFGMGQGHVCALLEDGTVQCMGGGAQLGRGTQDAETSMAAVPGLDGATEIAASRWGTCVRAKPKDRMEGVYCWGDFTQGELIVPTHVRGLDGTTGLVLHGTRACAERAGQLVCLERSK